MPSPLIEAAFALGISQRELQRWIADGAPVVCRGRRGRGNKTMLDVEAIAAWRAARTAPRDAARVALVALAAQLPERLSGEIAALYGKPLQGDSPLWRLLRVQPGPAAALHGACYLAATDAVRALIGKAIGAEALPPLTRHPEAIERLEKIARL